MKRLITVLAILALLFTSVVLELPERKVFAGDSLIQLSDVKAYARLEQSGCRVSDKLDRIRLRFDLYLKPDAPGYSIHHVPVMIESGEYDKEGNPIMIPTGEYRDNPFLCAFIYLTTATSDSEIKTLEQDILQTGYAYWVSNKYSMRGVNKELNPVLFSKVSEPDLSSRAQKTDRLIEIIASQGEFDLNAGLSLFSFFRSKLIYAGDPIDVGAEAINRTFSSSIYNYTRVDANNPANDTGAIDTVELYFNAAGGTVYVGTFSADGNDLTCRDSESVGAVSDGSTQQFTGLDIDIETGDYIGLYDKTGSGSVDTEYSGAGLWRASGEVIDPEDSDTFTWYSSRTMSIWGEGETAGGGEPPDPPTNVSATDGVHTDKVVITWTKSDGATNYTVYRDDVDISGLLGDVATYDDNGATAATITSAGTAAASDGTSTAHVTLSLAGEATGTTSHVYTVTATNGDGESEKSGSDTGYRGVGAITYQWQVDNGGGFANIAGATTDPYNYTGADAPTITPGNAAASDGTSSAHVVLSVAGESASNGTTWDYQCIVSANGASNSPQTSTSDTGYRGTAALTYTWYRSNADADAAFASIAGEGGTTDPYNDTNGATDPDGRWYYCEIGMSDAVSQDTTHDRGYKDAAPPPTPAPAYSRIDGEPNKPVTIQWPAIPGAVWYKLYLGGSIVYEGNKTYARDSYRGDTLYSLWHWGPTETWTSANTTIVVVVRE